VTLAELAVQYAIHAKQFNQQNGNTMGSNGIGGSLMLRQFDLLFSVECTWFDNHTGMN